MNPEEAARRGAGPASKGLGATDGPDVRLTTVCRVAAAAKGAAVGSMGVTVCWVEDGAT